MDEKIIARLSRQTSVPELVEVLSEKIEAADLQTLLLEIYSRRTAKLSPAEVLKNYQSNRFAEPSSTPVALMQAFDRLAFHLAGEHFQPMELSPVSPLGSCSSLGKVHQNKVLSATRHLEVLADCTNILALECAHRRQALLKIQPKNQEKIRLCTSHRLVRTQPLPDPRFLSHFRIFGLCTAGRDEGNFNFELAGLKEHLGFHLSLLTADSPFQVEKIEAKITELEAGRHLEAIEREVLEPLRTNFPAVCFEFFPERKTGRGYYKSLCFNINASNTAGDFFNLCDGGFTDWTQKMLENRKERLLISAIGSELMCRNFLANKA